MNPRVFRCLYPYKPTNRYLISLKNGQVFIHAKVSIDYRPSNAPEYETVCYVESEGRRSWVDIDSIAAITEVES